MLKRSLLAATAAAFLTVAVTPALGARGTAPGAPGNLPDWTAANKDGFGTANGTASKVWHTLSNGELTEVYYPDLGTPAVRDLQFVVSDGRTVAERETDATTHVTRLADPQSLTYRQVNTAKSGLYRITKTYAEDPTRNALLSTSASSRSRAGTSSCSSSTTRRCPTRAPTTPAPRAAA